MSDSMDSPDRSYSPTTTYWSRQLMKVEENDPYRLACDLKSSYVG